MITAIAMAAEEAIRALQAQVQALNAEVQRQQAESQRLSGLLQTGLGALPELVETLRRERGRGSVIDSRGVGRPPNFEDKKDKFVAWSRKVENYVVGSFGEKFRAVLEWAVEYESAIDVETYDLAYGPGAPDGIEELQDKVNQLFTLLTSLTEDESNDIVVGSGKGNGLEAWRRLHRRWDPSTGSRKRNLLKSVIAPPRCKAEELAACLERWNQQMKRYERRKDPNGNYEKISDDIKQAALEMLVPEDLENHLVLNKHRLTTFQMAHDEIVTIIEARTGVTVKEPSIRQPTGRADRDAMDVDSFGKGKGKGRGKGRGKGKQGGAQKFQGTCHNCGKVGHKASECWSKQKDQGAKDKGKSKGQGKGQAKGKGKGKGKNKSAYALEDAGAPAESGSTGALDMGPLDLGPLFLAGDSAEDVCPLAEANSVSRDEWIRMNLDSGAAVSAFPRRMAPPGAKGNGTAYRTASGELIKDEGSMRVRAEDERGFLRSLTGRVADVHKPLVSQARCAEVGQNTWLTKGGGWMVHKSSKVSQKIGQLLEQEAKKPGHTMLPIHEERGVYNFYLKVGDKGSLSALEDKPLEQCAKEELIELVRTLRRNQEAAQPGNPRQQ